MRIAYIEPIRFPTEKAHGYQIAKTCEAFVAAGASVVLFVTDRETSGAEAWADAYGLAPGAFSVERLPVTDGMGLPGLLKPLAFAAMRMSFVRSVRRILPRLRTDFDAWYTRDLGVAEALASAAARLPVFVELHDEPAGNARRFARLKPAIAGWVVISRGLRDRLVGLGIDARRIHVAPDGFDPALFDAHPDARAQARSALGVSPDAFLAAYAGHLYPWKGVDGIAAAFPRLPEGAEIALVGGYADDIARVKAAMGGEAPRVRFLGQRPRAEAARWLQAADVAILPTSAKFDIGRSFTSPLKLFEALAAGRPILASDVPTSREILNDSTAWFFAPDDADGFLTAFRSAAQETAPQRAMREAACRSAAKPYAWSARGVGIVSFLRDASVSTPSGRGLLIVTQAVDPEDTNLAFFLSWIREFSRTASVVHVAAWKVGTRLALPDNVHVYAMPQGKLRRIVALLRLSWSIRHGVDAVFVHMLAPVAAALGWFWRSVLRRRIVLWYTHGSVPPSLHIAERFVDRICTASEESLRLLTSKKTVTGHGIDGSIFHPDASISRHPEILTVGRITPRKCLERVLVLAGRIRAAHPDLAFRVRIVGAPYLEADEAYAKELEADAAYRGLAGIVRFEGPLRGDALVAAYRSAALFVSASETGSLDKAVLEAVSCGCPAIVASSVYTGILGVEVAPDIDGDVAAERVAARLRERRELDRDTVEAVARRFSLDALVSRLSAILFA